jgi:SOS-response transcriptional repressor LexA
VTTKAKRPPITKRQRAVYDWIKRQHEKQGYGVGVREIGIAFGWSSPGAAYCHLNYLEKRGYVTRVKGRANSIVPVGA